MPSRKAPTLVLLIHYVKRLTGVDVRGHIGRPNGRETWGIHWPQGTDPSIVAQEGDLIANFDEVAEQVLYNTTGAMSDFAPGTVPYATLAAVIEYVTSHAGPPNEWGITELVADAVARVGDTGT